MSRLLRLYQIHRLRQSLYAKHMKTVGRFTFSPEVQESHLRVRITSTPKGKVLYFDPQLLGETCEPISLRMRPILATFSRINHTSYEAFASMCDGNTLGVASGQCLYYCDTREGVPMLVDPYFYNLKGYAKFAAMDLIPWAQREAKLVWRGSTTGSVGHVTTADMTEDDQSLCLRTRLVLMAKQDPRCDVKFVEVVQSSNDTRDHARLLGKSLLGDYIKEKHMMHFRYGLDIDGNTNSWSQFVKLARLGCCIFKVDSPMGFRQWYSHRFEPMHHFIPVRADLSDFQEKLDWAYSNPEACEAIAMSAHDIASSMTIERELNRTARAIQAIL